jgi:hypothetical protein
MTLPASGAIAMSDVNTELGHSAGTAISLNDADVRELFAVSSGAIAMSDGYGEARYEYQYSRIPTYYYWQNSATYTLIYYAGSLIYSGTLISSPYVTGGYNYVRGTQQEIISDTTLYSIARALT